MENPIDPRVVFLKDTFLDQIKQWNLVKGKASPAIAKDDKLQEILLHGYETLMSYAKHLNVVQKTEESLKLKDRKYDAFVGDDYEPSIRIEIMQSMAINPFLADLIDHLAGKYNEKNLEVSRSLLGAVIHLASEHAESIGYLTGRALIHERYLNGIDLEHARLLSDKTREAQRKY